MKMCWQVADHSAPEKIRLLLEMLRYSSFRSDVAVCAHVLGGRCRKASLGVWYIYLCIKGLGHGVPRVSRVTHDDMHARKFSHTCVKFCVVYERSPIIFRASGSPKNLQQSQ